MRVDRISKDAEFYADNDTYLRLNSLTTWGPSMSVFLSRWCPRELDTAILKAPIRVGDKSECPDVTSIICLRVECPQVLPNSLWLSRYGKNSGNEMARAGPRSLGELEIAILKAPIRVGDTSERPDLTSIICLRV